MKNSFILLVLVTLCLQTRAQKTTSLNSPDALIHNFLSSGKSFEGMSFRNGINTGDAFQIRFKDYNPAKKEYSGEIKWTAFSEIDQIFGKVNGNKIAFYQYMRESTEIVSAVLMSLESDHKMSGTWEGKGRLEGKKGTLYFTLNNNRPENKSIDTKVENAKPVAANPPTTTAETTTSSNSIIGVYYGNATGFHVATGTIELKAGGIYIRKNGNKTSTGRYTLKGNKVIFDGELRAWNNGEAEINGNNMRFAWLMDGVVIQFLFRKA